MLCQSRLVFLLYIVYVHIPQVKILFPLCLCSFELVALYLVLPSLPHLLSLSPPSLYPRHLLN